MSFKNISMLVVVVLASCGEGNASLGGQRDVEGAESWATAQPGVIARTPGQPQIDSVTTSDGFTQFRQNAQVQIVIEGKKLQTTARVIVGPFEATIDSIAAHEVRASFFTCCGQSPGPLDVTVVADIGTVTRPAAVTLTPFVVSPTAVTGKGTFESPINLCDPQIAESGFGSTVLLLSGTHACGRVIEIGDGSIVQGAADGSTIVRGTDSGELGINICCNAVPGTTFRDITLQEPLRAPAIFAGDITVERVVDAGGISALFGPARIDHYSYTGSGLGLDVVQLELTSSAIHCLSGDGIHIAVDQTADNGSRGSLDHVVVQGCDNGLVVSQPDRVAAADAQVTNSQFIDNVTGMQFGMGASSSITDTVISDDEATPRASSRGIVVRATTLSVSRVEIRGQDQVGIAISRGSQDRDTLVSASAVTIAGGAIGIELAGVDNQLGLFNSIVRDQTSAAFSVTTLDGFINLQDNALSVVSGFAIDDRRQTESFSSRYLHVGGTTLNGVSFEGQTIEGPDELAPFYRIASADSGIQFFACCGPL